MQNFSPDMFDSFLNYLPFIYLIMIFFCFNSVKTETKRTEHTNQNTFVNVFTCLCVWMF